MIYGRITGLKKEIIDSFDVKTGIKMVDISKKEVYENGELELVAMYNAEWLANRMVEEEYCKYLDRKGAIAFPLRKLKSYVEYKEDRLDRVFQKDEEGFRKYSKKLKFDGRAVAEIREAKTDMLRLKKAWEWEVKEHVENSEYTEEVALFEQYFNRFLQDVSDWDKEKLYPDGWASLIERVDDVGYWQKSIEDVESFKIIGEADIVTRDTLYFVTKSGCTPFWAFLYLNILNLIYQKPLLAVLRITSKGVLLEQNIYKVNSDEEEKLIELCEKCVEEPLKEKEVKKCFDYYEVDAEEIKMSTFDRREPEFIHKYIDDVIEGLEEAFEADTIPFIKKIFTDKNPSEYTMAKIELTRRDICNIMLHIIDALSEMQAMIGDCAWRLIVKNVVNNNNFLPIFTPLDVEREFLQAEVFLKITRVLAPLFFAYSTNKQKSNNPFILTRADYRKINLELVLNKQQRDELEKFLTSEKLLGNYYGNENIMNMLSKRFILKKQVSDEYFIDNDVTVLRMPFKFIDELKCSDHQIRRSDSSSLSVVIIDVKPSCLLKDDGSMDARIEVICEGISYRYDKRPRIVFTFTTQTPHEVLDAFFKSFWIPSCTYDFDSWVKRLGNIDFVQEGSGYLATVDRKKMYIEFLQTKSAEIITDL